MMNYIQHKGKKYEIKEPTIQDWSDVMKLKDLLDEHELYVSLIEKITGLSKKDIMESDAATIQLVGQTINNIMNQGGKNLQPKIELNGIKYNLLDTTKISFGQFVDIDSFLKKDEAYRIANLNELAAYLYCEEGLEYGKSDFPKRIEQMKMLPYKNLEGALFFLSTLGRGLLELSDFYSKNKVMWEIMKLRIALMRFGGGIKESMSLLKTRFGKLIILLLSPLWLVLTICLTLWTSIKKPKG